MMTGFQTGRLYAMYKKSHSHRKDHIAQFGYLYIDEADVS